MDRIIKQHFASASVIHFENGMDNPFSLAIEKLFNPDTHEIVRIMDELIESSYPDAVVASEALKLLGDIEDTKTHKQRRVMLERYLLYSEDNYIRDGALHGLSTMYDKESLKTLRIASNFEKSELLKHLIDDLITHLERED